MRKRTKAMIVGASALCLAVGGAGVASATGVVNGENDKPIVGKALEEASSAALQATGGGQVTASEVGDEESNYQVEVTKADGSRTDVQLDQAFNVVAETADNESEGGSGSQGDG